MLKHTIVIFMLLFLGIYIFAAANPIADENKDGKPDQWFEMENGDTGWIKTDRNFDGFVDYNVRINGSGAKLSEELDFNYDGHMDDFYFYKNGVLIRQEIDSNFDRKIDIWIYIYKGVYIERIETDKDFDGKLDSVETFGDGE